MTFGGTKKRDNHFFFTQTNFFGVFSITYTEFWFSQLYRFNKIQNRILKLIASVDCKYRVVESSCLVSVLFREVFIHHTSPFIHLIVNCSYVII